MNIEKKKKELERIKVHAAKAEMEFKIYERLEDIKRLEDNIKNQEIRIKEIDAELKLLED